MLVVRNLVKTYDDPRGGDGAARATALAGVSFEVAKGEFFTLVGPSGCGKTTLLQCIAGLEVADSGEILLDGKAVYSGSARICVPSNERALGMVFQSYAIWPHMSVFENVAFPLKHGRVKEPATRVRDRVMASLERVKLSDYAHRPAPHLSGGQQQRIALARALVHEPRLVLLDEPLSNLDAKLREDMRLEIRDLVKTMNMTALYVTHDQVEALSMSDRLALLRSGSIVQMGTPREVYLGPMNGFVADFMGGSNVVAGRARQAVNGGAQIEVETPFGLVVCPNDGNFSEGTPVSLIVRPHALRLRSAAAPERAENVFQGKVAKLSFLGERIEGRIEINDYPLRMMLDPYAQVQMGDRISIELPSERCSLALADQTASIGGGGH